VPHFHLDVADGQYPAEGIDEDNVKIDVANGSSRPFGSVTTQAAEHCHGDRRDHICRIA
jgi:hypothetical protein